MANPKYRPKETFKEGDEVFYFGKRTTVYMVYGDGWVALNLWPDAMMLSRVICHPTQLVKARESENGTH